MANDRGTLSRGGVQQEPWAGPTTPAGRRLPSAPRERKPALAILAVLLIVGGALAAGLVVVRSAQRVGAIEITGPVTAGELVPASAMSEVMIPSDTGVRYVAWHEESVVTQWYATENIAKGTLLDQGMISQSNPLSKNEPELGLALKDGQLPVDLQPGDTISIYSTANDTTGCPGKPGDLLAQGATVVSFSASSTGTGTTDVVVEIAPGTDVGTVMCNSANGTAGIAVTAQGA
jgi:hypothetical protein